MFNLLFIITKTYKKVLNNIMHPILLKFGSLTIYSYGAMVAIGFALSAFLIYRRAPKFNVNKDRAVDLVIVVLISGILGARLLTL